MNFDVETFKPITDDHPVCQCECPTIGEMAGQGADFKKTQNFKMLCGACGGTFPIEWAVRIDANGDATAFRPDDANKPDTDGSLVFGIPTVIEWRA